MGDFEEIIVFLALLAICISFMFVAIVVYSYRRKHAQIIDDFKDLANKADNELRKAKKPIDKEVYRAYKIAFIKSIDVTKQGLL